MRKLLLELEVDKEGKYQLAGAGDVVEVRPVGHPRVIFMGCDKKYTMRDEFYNRALEIYENAPEGANAFLTSTQWEETHPDGVYTESLNLPVQYYRIEKNSLKEVLKRSEFV